MESTNMPWRLRPVNFSLTPWPPVHRKNWPIDFQLEYSPQSIDSLAMVVGTGRGSDYVTYFHCVL